jgi:hypothetical protein
MSYNKVKTDPTLGQKVHEYLVTVGVETPITNNGLSRQEKIDKIENNFNQIMDTLDLIEKMTVLLIALSVLQKCTLMKSFGVLIMKHSQKQL